MNRDIIKNNRWFLFNILKHYKYSCVDTFFFYFVETYNTLFPITSINTILKDQLENGNVSELKNTLY